MFEDVKNIMLEMGTVHLLCPVCCMGMQVYVIGDVGIGEELDLLGINWFGGPDDAGKTIELKAGFALPHDENVSQSAVPECVVKYSLVPGEDKLMAYPGDSYYMCCICACGLHSGLVCVIACQLPWNTLYARPACCNASTQKL